MADTKERRPPGRKAADQDAANVTRSITAAADVRRRRAASWRLPPLASGYRDPIDALDGLPIPRRGDYCRGMFNGSGKWVPCCGR
jgi:hypothetical protein